MISKFAKILAFLIMAISFSVPPAIAVDDEDDLEIPYERCGDIKAIIPVNKDLFQIVIDQQKYGINTYYYFKGAVTEGYTECNKLEGLICWSVLKQIKPTEQLKKMGVNGNKMTIIHDCAVPN